MTDGDPLLELVDVRVTLSGLRILDGVDLRVPAGSVTGLIGPNGAGKTTVFNVISGFVRPDSGQVRYRGSPLGRIRSHRLTRMGIARTLQGVGLFASMTAVENVMQGASLRMRSGPIAQALAAPWTDSQSGRARQDALDALDALGIAGEADRYPAELPYPVQKKVALARALVARPQLLLLDEPAGGIGEADMAELASLIRGWTPATTVLLVEHHMELVMGVCDVIWVLDAGRVIASGSPQEIRNDPAVLAAYLGEDGAA